MALESPLDPVTPLLPVPWNTLRRPESSLRISYSSRPVASNSGRWRAYPACAMGASLDAREFVNTRTRTPRARAAANACFMSGPGTK